MVQKERENEQSVLLSPGKWVANGYENPDLQVIQSVYPCPSWLQRRGI